MTIKERAKEWADNFVVGDAYFIVDILHKVAKESYEKGATEQKAIDDEQLPIIKETYYNAGYETAENKMVDKACEWLKKYCGMNESGLVQFRKAMEE